MFSTGFGGIGDQIVDQSQSVIGAAGAGPVDEGQNVDVGGRRHPGRNLMGASNRTPRIGRQFLSSAICMSCFRSSDLTDRTVAESLLLKPLHLIREVVCCSHPAATPTDSPTPATTSSPKQPGPNQAVLLGPTQVDIANPYGRADAETRSDR
jgi:hypothetical protein